MDDPRNAIDLDLLRSDPRGLLVRHQETIGIIVRTYVRTGMFHPADTDDIIQQINAELLGKLPRISAQFNGSTLVRTYLSSIIRHICLNLHKKQKAVLELVRIEEVPAPPSPGDAERDLALEQSIRMLRGILAQYHAERPRLIVCLKIMYRIPITRDEVLAWWPACPGADRDAIVAASQEMDRKVTDKEAFARIHPFFVKAEGTTSSHDSIRRWTDERIAQIIHLLNGTPPAAAHTKETLGILMDDLAAPFLLRR